MKRPEPVEIWGDDIEVGGDLVGRLLPNLPHSARERAAAVAAMALERLDAREGPSKIRC